MVRTLVLLILSLNFVVGEEGICGTNCQCVCRGKNDVLNTTFAPQQLQTTSDVPQTTTVGPQTTTDGPQTTSGGPQTTSDGPKPYHDIRLPTYLQPLHYNVFLSVDMESKNVSGNVMIDLKITNSTKYVIVHALGFHHISGKVRNDKGNDISVRRQFSYSPNQYHMMELEDVIRPGRYQLLYVFSYTLKTTMAGFYQFTYRLKSGELRAGAFTQFQATDARTAFPCFDEPALRATFDISIQHPDNYIAISNMPVQKRWFRKDGPPIVDTFSTTPSMPTYLLAFAVVQFDMIRVTAKTKSPVQMTFYAPAEQISMVKYAIKVAKTVLPFYEKYYNVSYPLPKADMIAVPEFSAGAMENWGLIGYRMKALLHDEQMSSLSSRSSVATYITHELAHMWFGNLVTMHWWSDLWLNEGFATYMEYLGANAVFPEWKFVDFMVAHDMQKAMKLDSLVTSHPIYVKVNHPDEIYEIFDAISYQKGACLIRMLDNVLGTTTFNKGITSYLKNHSFGVAKTEDLWEALTKVSLDAGKNYNISYIMNTWTLQMGFPLITVTKIAPGTFRLTQERFLSDPDPDLSKAGYTSPYNYKWVIPFNFVVMDPSQPSADRVKLSVKKVWLNMTDAVIKVGSDKMIKGNAGQYGYFRVTYDQQGWDGIIKQLRINHQVFDIKDRVGLIADAFALAASNRLKYGTALNLIEYIKDETEYLPWKAAVEALGFLNKRLSHVKQHKELYEAFVKKKTSTLYEKFGFKKVSGFLERKLQVLIANAACDSGHDACKEKAGQLFKRWKKGSSIPSDFQRLVLFYGVRDGGEEDWNFVFNQYLQEKVPSLKITLLVSLCATNEPRLMERLLQYSQNSSVIRSQDVYYIFRYIYTQQGRYHAWYFVKENWISIVEKHPTQIGRIIDYLLSGFGSMEEYQQVKDFFTEERMKGAGKVTRTLEQSLEKIKSNHQWTVTHAQEVTNWLTLSVSR